MMVSFRSATWRVGLRILVKRSCHGNWDIALEIDARLALLNCQTFLLYAGGGGKTILILQNVIWCLQVRSREGLTPLLSMGVG